MITAVPPDTPVTTPVLIPMVATEVLPLVQLPPVVEQESVVVLPTQIGDVPPVIVTVLIPTVVEATALQPPVPVIVTVYTPAIVLLVIVLVGFCSVDVKPPGPDQL